ncbi:M14 family metallopeptidase [Chryseobacterium culicis]|nr:M14 family metallopeptidase [Chryseobacterium culicis]
MKTKQELKLYFENGDIPKQEDFWEWQDSYWHKDEMIPLNQIENIDALSVGGLLENIKTGGVRNWVLGSYKAGEVVRYLDILWKAKVDITSAVPGNNANWEVYFPFPKSPGLFTSHSTTLTINVATNTVTLIGSSTNKIITNQGVFNVRAQSVDTSANPTYYAIVYNTLSTNARAVTIYDNAARPLGVNDYVLFYVLNLNSTLQDVFGAKGYTLINTIGTTAYPIKPVAPADVLYNKTFSTWQGSRTSDEKFWLSKSILDAEFYNVKDNAVVTLYGLGKNVTTTNSYLGFIYAETGKPALFLYADEFNNAFSMPYDPVLHSGIKTYYLRSGTKRESNTTIYGKVTIDWSQVPNEKRVVESNSGVTNNSNLGRTLYKKSELFNNPLGFVKFARSRSFNDYYSAPTLDSYSGADGSGIPKKPYEDCREWSLKWDELITNTPPGYSITKETLTTDVPTDTNVDGKLPIYGYTFLPNKLTAGDPTGNNAQTLPRVVLNCSIHGFEKTPSFVVYEFMKQVLTNWKSHPFLEYLRFNVEFVIIPFANPHGWNAGSGAGTRKNFNLVDLNRNFPTFWAGGGTSADPTFPGQAALSEIESQAIYTFMQEKITSNTIMGVDFHNFHGTPQTDPKNYNMAWVVNLGSELGQNSANVLMKELSAKYKAKSLLIPQSDDYYIGQSNNYNGPGFSGSTMKSLGALYASTFEICQNFRFNPAFKSHDSDAITFGLETFTNYLRVFLAEHLDEYNRTK